MRSEFKLSRFCQALMLALVAVTEPAAAAPRRIASLNLCTDEMALLLVEKSRLVSISFLGEDPAESPLAAEASGIPVNHGDVEEVLAVHPDLVLTGTFTTPFAKGLLRRLGYEVVEVPIPETIADIGRVLHQVAAALGEDQRASDLIAEMNRRLAEVARDRVPRSLGTALVYDANGSTDGRPSVMDDVMTIVGLDNLAPRLGIGAYGEVPIETLLVARPDYLVHLIYRPDAPSLAEEVTHHPALRGYTRTHRILTLPVSFLSCGTPLVAQAAEQLAAAVKR